MKPVAPVSAMVESFIEFRCRRSMSWPLRPSPDRARPYRPDSRQQACRCEAEKGRGVDRRKAQRLFERKPKQAHAIAHRARHVEQRAGERAVRRARSAPRDRDSCPYSANVARLPPTGGIASVTSIGLARPRNARRSIAGSTCTPSTIRPNEQAGVSSAAAIGPGSRLSIARMALNRWVKPVSPSAIAACVCA